MASALSYRAGIRHAREGALALALGFVARSAGAAPAETEPIRIEYTAPAGCPDASEFRGRVFERTSKARPATDAELARTFVVVIETTGAGTQGSLVVRQEGMSTVARRVSGKDCDEVARALALATALAIDPEAALGPPEETTSGETGTGENAGATTAPPPPPTEDRGQRTDTPPTGRTPRRLPSERRFALLLGPSAAFGPAPTPSFGATAAFEWSSQAPIMLPAALGLEVVALTSKKHAVAGADSSFGFVFARPYVCAFGLALSAELGLVPCVGAELGAVMASGSGLANPASETRFWSAAELALRFDVALSDDWFLDATASLVFPFTRYHFVFEAPDTPIHDVPPVSAALGLRIGRRL